MQNGKGDKRRPKSVDYETYSRNWDAIFGKSKTKRSTKNVKKK